MDLVGKKVKFNSIFSGLTIEGKVVYVFEWENGEPKSYLVRHWLSKPGEKVLATDIIAVVDYQERR